MNCPSCGQPLPDGFCEGCKTAIAAEASGPTFSWYETHCQAPDVRWETKTVVKDAA